MAHMMLITLCRLTLKKYSLITQTSEEKLTSMHITTQTITLTAV